MQPPTLVCDSSVLIDLERAGLLRSLFLLPMAFAVPDRLYERELRPYEGEQLLPLGLQVREPSESELQEIERLVGAEKRISIVDAAALVLAKTGPFVLLVADAALRTVAEREGVECHGVLWVFDRLEEHRVVTTADLHAGLSRIAASPRCRLPRAEVEARLQRYSPGG